MLRCCEALPIMQMKQQEKNPLLLSTRSNGRQKKKVLCGNNAFKRTFTQLSGFFYSSAEVVVIATMDAFSVRYVVISSEKRDLFRIVLPLALESLFGREMGFWYLVAPFWFFFLFII